MAWGQKGSCRLALGRSRGGWTTKIVALLNVLGNLARFVLFPGQRHDSIAAPGLIEGMQALLAATVLTQSSASNTLRNANPGRHSAESGSQRPHDL